MTKEQKILLLFVLLIAGSGTALYLTKSGNTPTATVQTPSTSTNTNTQTQGDTAGVGTQPSATVTGTVTTPAQNKTLTQVEMYEVPNGNKEEITVTVIVDGAGNIIDVKFAYNTPTNPESSKYLEKFNRAFTASSLVGKKIGSVKASRVGGASLTTGAFNQAIATLAAKV
jgi:hypothetical protein